MAKSNKKVVPESHKALDALKYEIAAELGLPVGAQYVNTDVEFATEFGSIPGGQMKEDYWGHISSRDAGTVGGTITSRLVKKAEEMLFQL